jgi:acetyl esterase/lipase
MLTTGITRFNLNPTLIAIGGSSAGGNLAAVMTHKLLTHNSDHPENPLPFFKAQLLIVPVTDNTASIWNNESWRDFEFTPALPAKKMEWYRNHYLPDERRRGEPEASPLFYTDNAGGVKERWRRLPKALVVVGELDVLRDEGVAYAQRLMKNGVEAQLKVMKGMPHPFLAMDGVLKQGRDTISYMVEMLNEVFVKFRVCDGSALSR